MLYIHLHRLHLLAGVAHWPLGWPLGWLPLAAWLAWPANPTLARWPHFGPLAANPTLAHWPHFGPLAAGHFGPLAAGLQFRR